MLEMNEEKCFDGQYLSKDNYDAGFYCEQRNLNPEIREENLDNCNLEDVYVLEDVYQNFQNLQISENLINKKRKESQHLWAKKWRTFISNWNSTTKIKIKKCPAYSEETASEKR